MSKAPRGLRGAVATLGFAAIATAAMAQPSGGQSTQENQPGYSMMYGYPGAGPQMMEGAGAGPGMMQGWGGRGPGAGWGGPDASITDRLSALKDNLNITSSETEAWNSYAAAVTSAHKALWDGVRSIWQSAASENWGPDQRFDAMDKMVALMKQSYEQEKQAANALMPHLTPYQQGQAKEILPGLAASARGRGWGPMWGGGGWGPMMGGW